MTTPVIITYCKDEMRTGIKMQRNSAKSLNLQVANDALQIPDDENF